MCSCGGRERDNRWPRSVGCRGHDEVDILFRWLLCRLGVQIGWLRRGLLWLMANGFGIAWFMLMVRGCRRSLRW